MNRKKKLPCLGLMLLLILIHKSSFEQTFEPSLGNFALRLPSLSALNPNQQTPPPFYTFFLEYGNGRYIKIENENPQTNDQYVTVSKSISCLYPVQAGSTAVLNIVGHYDTIKPPRGTLHAIQNFSSGGQMQLQPQNDLASTEKIKPIYSDRTVIPGDTMTVGITYKPDLKGGGSNHDYIVAFFYNDMSNGGVVFNAINNPTQQYQSTGGSIKAIRVHDLETPYTDIANIPHSGIPDQVFTFLSAVKGNRSNAIYFKVKHGSLPDEKNIFISLGPKNINTWTSDADSTGVGCVIIKYDATSIINHQVKNDALPINLYARDPNGITTSPECVDDGEGSFGFYDQRVRYAVQFQNDGKGKARDVQLVIKVPYGIKFPATLNPTCIVGGTTITLKNKVNFPNALNTYLLKESPGREIVIMLDEINLPGTLGIDKTKFPGQGGSPVFVNTYSKKKDPFAYQRNGQIYFILKTEPTGPTVQCMRSEVSITFYNTDQTPNKVIKDWGLTRHKCTTGCNVPVEIR